MVDNFVQYRSHLKPLSRELRQNLTSVEQILWSKIRRKQLGNCQFYRQKPLGPYILDFYCPSKKLIIELDGGQHYLEQGEIDDQKRDEYLATRGFTTLRFSNREINEEIDRVMEKIYAFVMIKNLP